MRAYDIITFDCYGTLIDWNAGIIRAFQDAAAADGVDLESKEILRAYHDAEPVVERESYLPYREVLSQVAQQCAKSLDWELDPNRSGFLADSVGSWTPFSDTNPMLERLKALGCQLGILSNIDEDLFAQTQEHFTVASFVAMAAMNLTIGRTTR